MSDARRSGLAWKEVAEVPQMTRAVTRATFRRQIKRSRTKKRESPPPAIVFQGAERFRHPEASQAESISMNAVGTAFQADSFGPASQDLQETLPPRLLFLMYRSLTFDTEKSAKRRRCYSAREERNCCVAVPPGVRSKHAVGCGPGVTETISELGDRHEKEDISGRDEYIVACNDQLGRRQRKG